MTSILGALFFLALLGWAFALMALRPRMSLGGALLGALCFMLLTAYLGVIVLNLMSATAYALIYGGLGCLVLGFRVMRKHKLTAALPLYLLLSAAYAIVTINVLVCDHDALSFWARAVKELFTFERFYIHADNPMFHTDYLPLPAALQYCIVRVFGWRDAYPTYVTFACLSVSICAIAELPRKQWCGFLLGGALFYAISVFNTNYVNLRTDVPMSALFTAGLCLLFTRRGEEAAELAPIALLAGALTGLKIYIGLLFALSICLCTFYQALSARRKAKSVIAPAAQPRPSARAYASAALVGLALMLFVQLSWSGIYNFSMDKASYELAVIGGKEAGAEPVFNLSYLIRGNPRTSQLMDSFSPENLRSVGNLIADTALQYIQSNLVWVWLFIAGALALLFRREREQRAPYISALIAMLITGAVFVLGLFGSYFVQAETSGAATVYLTGAAMPLCWLSLLIAFEALAEAPLKKLAPIMTGLMLAGLLVLSTPGKWLYRWTALPRSPYNVAALATTFYNDAIPGELTEADAGKTALLIDCSSAATYLSSVSGKTHAYQYYGLPVYVTVYQFSYGDDASIQTFSRETVTNGLLQSHGRILILNVDDPQMWQLMRDALHLPDDAPKQGVYDVVYGDDGEYTLIPRNKSAEET